MTIVTNKEFMSNHKRYFDLAINEQVCIKRGRNMFKLVYTPADNNAELSANGEFINAAEYMTFMNKSDKPKPEKPLSEMFWGVLSKESAESLREHVKTMREEWDT
jgi:hypothetical protein